MSTIKLPAASGGGSISIKGPSSSSSDVDLLDTSGNLNLEDGKKLILGTGDDFQIHHDGSGTNLDCTNSNPLYIQSDLIHLMREDGNEWYMKCTKDAAVELYYDNSKKLETTSFGATVTGDLTINSSGLNNSSVSGQALQISGTTRPTLILRGNSDGTQVAEIQFADNSGTDDSNTGVRSGLIQYSHASNFMAFRTDATERMRIDSSGNVNINNTGNLDAYRLAGSGSSLRGHLFLAAGNSASTSSQEQFLTGNRLDSDGALITFSQNGTQEGSVSVSGSTVSYNGGHLSRWSQIKGLSSTDKAARPEIYQGTVMSNLDDLCEWEGEENQQLNMTKVSDVDGDKDVAGVFWTWDDDDDKVVNDFFVAMTGDMVIRVAASTTVARGDLLISAGDGTAKPQADDIIRSSTIAKIISTNSTATYADGSKAYPCVLMAC